MYYIHSDKFWFIYLHNCHLHNNSLVLQNKSKYIQLFLIFLFFSILSWQYKYIYISVCRLSGASMAVLLHSRRLASFSATDVSSQCGLLTCLSVKQSYLDVFVLTLSITHHYVRVTFYFSYRSFLRMKTILEIQLSKNIFHDMSYMSPWN